jgi:MFS family permease
VAAVALVPAFVGRARRVRDPFIPLQLLAGRGFAVMNVVNFLFGCSALGLAALVPLYAQDRYGMSAVSAGSLLTARAVGTIAITALAVMAQKRTGYRLPILVGSLLNLAGLVATATAPPGDLSPYVWLSATAALSGLGIGLSLPASNNAILALAPERVAAVSGLRGMFRQAGGIVAITITTAVLVGAPHPGLTMATMFLVFAGITALSLPLIAWVPNHPAD